MTNAETACKGVSGFRGGPFFVQAIRRLFPPKHSAVCSVQQRLQKLRNSCKYDSLSADIGKMLWIKAKQD